MIALGIDIGGTGIKAGCLDESGIRRAELEEPTPSGEGPEALLEVLSGIVRRLEEKAGEGIWALGVGCAGLITPGAGVVRTSPNLPHWRNVPLSEMILERVGRRPTVLNDANAFTLAEARIGAAKNASSVLGLTMGTGVGGGLVLGGRIWEGGHGYAGEMGHVPVDLSGPACACGARGCLEALIGTKAILARYIAAAAPPMDEIEKLTPRRVAERARSGDVAAKETFRETGRLLGIGLCGFVHLFDPEVIVIGGGVANSADLLLPAARTALAERCLLPPEELPCILPAALGAAAGWIGAALAALDRF